MITAVLNGGLGNQMFQIAAAYALARDNKDLCAFNFNNVIAHQGKPASAYRKTVFKEIFGLSSVWKPSYKYREPRFAYSSLPNIKDLQLSGYFQSEKYFFDYKKDVVAMFKDTTTISKIKYNFDNSVSLHIRRGDYLVNRPDIHAVVPVSYYESAICYIELISKIEHVYVISDDIKWCKSNFKDKRIKFIDGVEDYVAMYIMSLCTHNVIANSTFSWWGAYLNENNPIVIAPTKWFGNGFYEDWQDIYCKNWIKF